MKGVSQAGQPEARELNPGGLQDVSLGLTHEVNQILERWFPLEGVGMLPTEMDLVWGVRKPKRLNREVVGIFGALNDQALDVRQVNSVRSRIPGFGFQLCHLPTVNLGQVTKSL